MKEERELERHNKVMEEINNSLTVEKLPNTSLNKIVSFLSTNVSYKGAKLPKDKAVKILEAVKKHGSFNNQYVKRVFINSVASSFEGISNDDIVDLYVKILKTNRVDYLIKEFNARNIKAYEISRDINLEAHKIVMADIKDAYDIKDLPKVGLGDLNKRLIKAFNSNTKGITYKTSDIVSITNAYLSKESFEKIKVLVKEICIDERLTEEVVAALINDETIEYTVEEIKAKADRRLKIYEMDHEDIMDAIKDARRISQLPPNISESALSSYLNGNTTIYTNDDRITTTDLKDLTNLLLSGKTFTDTVVIEEVKRIARAIYPEKEDAFILLLRKLKNLPRTYYLVEEINYAKTREEEFIERCDANVNVYLMPNNKSPLDGGKFYNVYINRVGELDLEGALPQNLEEIVPEGMDIDSVEWYVQEYIDETFKTAGGIILARDESIGNVKVFRPNDGTIGISVEAKAKMDEIEDLDKKIEEKKKTLEALEQVEAEKEKAAKQAEERLRDLIGAYETKALLLQAELIDNIAKVKNDVGISEPEKNEGSLFIVEPKTDSQSRKLKPKN